MRTNHWCSRQTHCFPKFSLEIYCRIVSNAEACRVKERVNWKASRATSGAAYFCEVRISGCGPGRNLAILRVDQGWKPGTLVVPTKWDLANCSQLSCEGFFCRREVNCRNLVLFFLPCLVSFLGLCALVTSSLDQDSRPWVVSKISHFGIAVSCSWCGDVILCSLSYSNVFYGY